MFGMSPWHVAILVVVALFVFGPERLPSMIKDLGKALRQVRAQAQSMQEDIKAELGPEVGDLDLRSLHPRTFVEKHLFGEEEDPLGLNGLRKDAETLLWAEDPEDAIPEPTAAAPARPVTMTKSDPTSDPTSAGAARASSRRIEPPRTPIGESPQVRYDPDAT
jgi:sec-independent protein translocase protein TatB